jgi:hypothetical protein
MVTKRFEAVFVVRLWREGSPGGASPWRGSATAATGEHLYFTQLDDLCGFLRDALPDANSLQPVECGAGETDG